MDRDDDECIGKKGLFANINLVAPPAPAPDAGQKALFGFAKAPEARTPFGGGSTFLASPPVKPMEETPIAKALLRSEYDAGDTIHVDGDGERLILTRVADADVATDAPEPAAGAMASA